MREARKTFLDIVLTDDPRQMILATACLTFSIGVFLALPFPVFSDFVVYRFMRYLPEWVWAAFFIVIGAAKITACLCNRALLASRWRYLPVYLNLTTTVLWTFVWAGVYISMPQTLATVVYFSFILAPTWCAVRRLRQAKEAARKRR